MTPHLHTSKTFTQYVTENGGIHKRNPRFVDEIDLEKTSRLHNEWRVLHQRSLKPKPQRVVIPEANVVVDVVRKVRASLPCCGGPVFHFLGHRHVNCAVSPY